MSAQPIHPIERSAHLNLVYAGPDEYYTDAENIWQWTKGTVEFRIVLNAGLNTDIASVPGLFGLSKLLGFTKDGAHRRGSVLHDALYLTIKLYKGIIPESLGRYEIKVNGQWVRVTSVWTRKQADDMFLYFMLADGVTPWKARTMYQAVRTFGGIHMKLT